MTRPPDDALVLIGGRSLDDYRQAKTPMRPGFTVVKCKGCGTSIAISPEAAANLDHPHATPLCATCLVVFMAGRKGVQLELTEHAKQVIETEPIARRNYELFKRIAKP